MVSNSKTIEGKENNKLNDRLASKSAMFGQLSERVKVCERKDF